MSGISLRKGQNVLQVSPEFGISTLITSAPRSLNILVQYPPENPLLISKTFIPVKAKSEFATFFNQPLMIMSGIVILLTYAEFYVI